MPSNVRTHYKIKKKISIFVVAGPNPVSYRQRKSFPDIRVPSPLFFYYYSTVILHIPQWRLRRPSSCSSLTVRSTVLLWSLRELLTTFSERPERRPGGNPRRRSSSPRCGGGRFGRRSGRRGDRARRWGSRRCVIIFFAHAVDNPASRPRSKDDTTANEITR